MAPGPNGWRMGSPLIDPRERQLVERRERRAEMFVFTALGLGLGLFIGAISAAAMLLGG